MNYDVSHGTHPAYEKELDADLLIIKSFFADRDVKLFKSYITDLQEVIYEGESYSILNRLNKEIPGYLNKEYGAGLYFAIKRICLLLSARHYLAVKEKKDAGKSKEDIRKDIISRLSKLILVEKNDLKGFNKLTQSSEKIMYLEAIFVQM